MSAKNSVSIACASAFWGDTPHAVSQILREPQLDYIVFDYLSEVTMTLLARSKKKDANVGYVPDFFNDVVEPHLKTCVERGITLVANAGAMNPRALKEKIEAFAASQNFSVKVAAIEGDDLLAAGVLPSSIKDIKGQTWEGAALLSANAYIGAPSLVAALKGGAQVVVTGRCIDAALVAAPLIYEFNYAWNDYDHLAQACLAGHIIECGTQCTGGNFTDWRSVPENDDMGFPILKVASDGSFVVGKAPKTGGLISAASVAEQLLYEIGDPRAYVLPDVVCDFSFVRVSETSVGVRVEGAKGSAPTATYKVSATSQTEWKSSSTAFIGGGDAKKKALHIGEALLKRCSRLLKEKNLSPFSETRLEALGGGEEAVLRISAAHTKPEALELLAKEMAPAATSLAPGLAHLFGGRAQAVPRIALVSFLIEKTKLPLTLHLAAQSSRIELPQLEFSETSSSDSSKAPMLVAKTLSSSAGRPLGDYAWARSGDKGNNINIGVIARKAEDYEFLKRELTPQKIADFFKADFDQPERAVVEVWELPSLKALNFLIHDCLGGGGAYSLRVDPQGKAFAQRLLELRVNSSEEVP